MCKFGRIFICVAERQKAEFGTSAAFTGQSLDSVDAIITYVYKANGYGPLMRWIL